MAWRRGLLGVACALALACSQEPSASARMRRTIEPYLEEMAAYDRWARRAGLADSAFRSEDALRETAFAPLRRPGRTRAAWLHREGPDERLLRHPPDAPELPAQGWVPVVTEELGELRAQQTTMSIGEEPASYTLIRRSRPAPGGATLHVTVAFEPGGASGAAVAP